VELVSAPADDIGSVGACMIETRGRTRLTGRARS
jgi:hypothetical protein